MWESRYRLRKIRGVPRNFVQISPSAVSAAGNCEAGSFVDSSEMALSILSFCPLLMASALA